MRDASIDYDRHARVYPGLRAAQSVWSRLSDGVEQRALTALADDLASGVWDARHGHLRTQPACDGGLRLVRSA